MEEHEPWATKPEDENVVVEIKSATFGWNEVGIFHHLISCVHKATPRVICYRQIDRQNVYSCLMD
jgi:hypothetical protein